MLENADTRNMGSEVNVIAKTILKAIASNNPKTKYVTGGNVKLILFMRKVLSDKLFDKIFMGQMK